MKYKKIAFILFILVSLLIELRLSANWVLKWFIDSKFINYSKLIIKLTPRILDESNPFEHVHKASFLKYIFRANCSLLLHQHSCGRFMVSVREDSVLEYSIMQQQEDLIAYLLKYENQLNKRTFMGNTPFLFAAKFGNVNIIKQLLKSGANLHDVNDLGENAILVACSPNMKGLDFVIPSIDRLYENIDYLLLNGLNINSVNKCGETVLHYLDCSETSIKLLDFLVTRGANINMADNFGNTPLHTLLSRSDFANCDWNLVVNFVFRMKELGASINLKNNNGRTPCDMIVEIFSSNKSVVPDLDSKLKLIEMLKP